MFKHNIVNHDIFFNSLTINKLASSIFSILSNVIVSFSVVSVVSFVFSFVVSFDTSFADLDESMFTFTDIDLDNSFRISILL